MHLKSYEPLRIIIILKLLQYHLNIMGRLIIATRGKLLRYLNQVSAKDKLEKTLKNHVMQCKIQSRSTQRG